MFKFSLIRYPLQRDFPDYSPYNDDNKHLVWINDNRRHGKYWMFTTDWRGIKTLAGFKPNHLGPVGASFKCWKRWFFG